MYEIIKKLCLTHGVSGRESGVAGIVSDMILPYADEVMMDAMGNVIAFKKGSSSDAKKLMLAAHMDEIGFIVTFIEDDGSVRFAPLGGHRFESVGFRNVVFANKTPGVIVPCADGSCSSADKMYVDIGAKNKRDAQRRVKIGDTFSVTPSLTKLAANRVSGRPLDDRIGCAILISAAARAVSVANDTYYVFTTQEEVGCRGGKTSSFTVQPDLGVALDITPAGDEHGSKNGFIKLGGGAGIKIMDTSVVCDAGAVDLMTKLAVERKISYQYEILTRGGTDASAMQSAAAGARAGAISIATRYAHTPVETVDMGDAEACADLAAALIETPLD